MPPTTTLVGVHAVLPPHRYAQDVITAEFAEFFLVNLYQPNSQRGLTRLDYRTREWDPAFLAHLKRLEARGTATHGSDAAETAVPGRQIQQLIQPLPQQRQRAQRHFAGLQRKIQWPQGASHKSRFRLMPSRPDHSSRKKLPAAFIEVGTIGLKLGCQR